MAHTNSATAPNRLTASVRCRRNNAGRMLERIFDLSATALGAHSDRATRAKGDGHVLDSALTATITPTQECCSMNARAEDMLLTPRICWDFLPYTACMQVILSELTETD
jgi:hypothetical protein